jgi:hypothetical protein
MCGFGSSHPPCIRMSTSTQLPTPIYNNVHNAHAPTQIDTHPSIKTQPKTPKEGLVFGKVFSDHMLEIDWDDEVRAYIYGGLIALFIHV